MTLMVAYLRPPRHEKCERRIQRASDGSLLVDDRDGRVLAELDDLESAFQALEDCDDPELAEARCIVRFDERHGALVGTESTTRVHLLT